MTALEHSAFIQKPAPPEFTEHVLPSLAAWGAEGARTALVTVVGIEGGAPRPIGAQMAVAEDGRAAGYISGGCLEGALIAEAQGAIAEGRNRLVRYGKGSPYIDVRLPCGSGLDIYIDQDLPRARAGEMMRLWHARRPFQAVTNFASGQSLIAEQPSRGAAVSARRGDSFHRVYWPQIRLALIGAGPPAAYLAMLAAQIGWIADVITPDASALGLRPQSGVSVREFYGAGLAAPIQGDVWTAGAVVFHDHEWEIPVLAALLRSPCFYIGAVGSRRVHELRLEHLRAEGFTEAELARISGPAGLIGGAKSPSTLAVSLLAEMAAAARDAGFTP